MAQNKLNPHTHAAIRNTVSLVTSQFIVRVFVLVVSIFLYRYLGVLNLGQYSFAVVYVGFFGLLTDLGLTTLVTREVSCDRKLADDYFNNYFALQLLLGILVLFLINASAGIFNRDPVVNKMIFIASFGIFFAAMTRPFNAMLAAFEEMHYTALVMVISNIINMILIGALIILRMGIIELSIIFTIVYFIQFLLLLFFTYKKHIIEKMRLVLDVGKCAGLLKDTFPFMLIMVFSMLYNKIDIIMLSKMKGDLAVGYYSAAYRIIDFLLVISSGMGAALFPLLSRRYGDSGVAQLSSICAKSSKYLASLAIPIASCTTILASRIITFLYGAKFENSYAILAILIWSVVMQFIYMILFHMLISIRKIYILVVITALGAGLNVILNLMLIPRFGYIGASISTVFSEVAILACCFIMAGRYLDKLLNFREIYPVVAASAVTCVFVILLRQINLLAICSLAVLVYAAMLWIVKFFKEDDIAIFKAFIFQRN